MEVYLAYFSFFWLRSLYVSTQIILFNLDYEQSLTLGSWNLVVRISGWGSFLILEIKSTFYLDVILLF